MTDVNRDKLVDRVRKLYAMSQETASSPHEAEIAARRVESMRAKYGITEAELEISEFSTVHTTGAAKMPAWRGWLALAVGAVNDCIVHRVRSNNKTSIVFSGFAQDTVLAQLQLDYIEQQMERHWNEYRATITRSSKAINSAFKRGYIEEMSGRLYTLAAEREKAVTSSGTALVPMKLSMVNAEFGVQRTTQTNKHYAGNNDARVAGRDAANRTGINGEITVV